jgi:hypothetical protein
MMSYQRWVVTWTFHFNTAQKTDAERLFTRIIGRTAVKVRLVGSGRREARPGTWVRGETDLRGSLAEAVLVVLDDAGKFGDHIDVTAPQRYDGGLTIFPGWIVRCSHSELAAVDFELKNMSPDPALSDDSRMQVSRWDKVLEALERLSVHKGLHPTLAAMRKLVEMLEANPTFSGIQPRLSHATLFLAHADNPRQVCVGWLDGEYDVAFVDPPLEISKGTRAPENEVLQILLEHLARLESET